MKLIGYELKKLFRLPALWVFVVLCMALNILFIVSDDFGLDFFNDTSETAVTLGQNVGEDYINSLSQLPQTENRDVLIQAVTGITDEFDDFDTETLSQYYQEQVKDSSVATKWLEWKYVKLDSAVEKLAQADASTSLYAGPMTHESHGFLFGTLLRAVSAESMVLAVLALLYMFGYERITGTELVICTTREGRRLWRVKTYAGIIASLMLLLLLVVVSLGVYFAIWDYSGIWSANVSSQFNYIQEAFMVKPFITWGSFTVAEYFAASLGIIAALTVISGLVASAIGALVRNTYAAALLMILLCAGGVSLSMAFNNAGLWAAFEISNLQPLSLWLTQNVWFTESGTGTVLPWQESIVAAVWLVLSTVGATLALRRFYRKDIK